MTGKSTSSKGPKVCLKVGVQITMVVCEQIGKQIDSDLMKLSKRKSDDVAGK